MNASLFFLDLMPMMKRLLNPQRRWDTANILPLAGANASADNNYCLFIAIVNGFPKIQKTLLAYNVDASEDDNAAIKIADVLLNITTGNRKHRGCQNTA
jgi:hypothetical protein